MLSESFFTDLCVSSLPMLVRVAGSILHSPMDAVQQGLLKAWQARARMTEPMARAYVTRIVINECRNIQRYRMRVTPLEQVELAPAPAADPALREALAALPEKLRLPLLLKYMEGMTEKECAACLHTTVSTVKNRLYRARKALAQELREEVSFK